MTGPARLLAAPRELWDNASYHGVRAISHYGWQGVVCANRFVSAVAVPDIGGRILGFALGPYQYLFTNPALVGKLFTPEEHQGDGSLAAWKNYGGSKTWPAPQGWDGSEQWAGPPDPVLDGGRYACAFVRDARGVGVTMTSASDPRTGLRITREVRVDRDSARLTLDLTFENVSQRPVRWAIWDVLQLECGRLTADGSSDGDDACWLYVPTNTVAPEPYRVLFGDDHAQWHAATWPGLLGIQFQARMGKIAVTSPRGWIAFCNQRSGYALCLRFPPPEHDAEYPDGGATVECWAEAPEASAPGLKYRAAGSLLEAEVLGPLRSLAPGERTSLAIEWAAARCDGPVVDVGAAGCTSRALEVAANGPWARVRGVFGCFEAGTLEVVWRDRLDRELGRHAVGLASPLLTARLDLRRSDNTLAGALGEADVAYLAPRD